MKLPKCLCQSTVTRIWSTLAGKLKSKSSNHAEFNGTGDELQRAVTKSESSSAAVNSNNRLAAKQLFSVAMDGRKWKRESWGTKSNRWCHPKPAKIPAEQSETVAGFKLRSPVFRLVSATRMARGRRPTSKLQIGTKLGWNGGQKWKLWPGHVRGSGRVFRSVVGSVWQLLSHSLLHVHMFPLFPAYSFTYKILNRLIFILNSHMLHACDRTHARTNTHTWVELIT